MKTGVFVIKKTVIKKTYGEEKEVLVEGREFLWA